MPTSADLPDLPDAGPDGELLSEYDARPRFRWWAFALIAAQAIPVAWLVLVADGWTVNRLVVRIWSWFKFDLGFDSLTPEGMDVILNTLMLLPTALLAALWAPRVRWWVWALAGLLVSLAFEGVQLALLPRDASWLDVLTNTIGALIGAGLGELINRRLARRRTQPAAVES